MPSSFCHLAVHVIFTTKDHRTCLKRPFGNSMHAYLNGIITNIGGITLAIGGIEDHVHILCLMPKDLSIGEFMAKIKANSSKWFREKHFPDFHWQDGYAAFSVSRSNISKVQKYIENQDEHHHNTSTIQEFEALLAKHQYPAKD